MTVMTLNMVWNIASWVCGAPGNMVSNRLPYETPKNPRTNPAMRNSTTPDTLKRRCMSAVRFAFFPLVNPARMATMHEPMLDPMVM